MPDADAVSCLAEYASRGPRYTSYPPATEFGPVPLDQVQREREIAALGVLRDLASYDPAAGCVRTTPLGRLLVQRLGDARMRRADLRVVAATNRAATELKHDLAARDRGCGSAAGGG